MPEGPSPLRAIYRAWRTGKLMRDYLLSYVQKTAPEPRGQVMAKITDENLTKKLGFPCFVTHNEWERIYDVHFDAPGRDKELIRFGDEVIDRHTETEAVGTVANLIRSHLDKQQECRNIEIGIAAGKPGEYRFDTGEPATVPKVTLGVSVEGSTPNPDGTYTVRIRVPGKSTLPYVAAGKIEANKMVQIDLATGKVSQAQKTEEAFDVQRATQSLIATGVTSDQMRGMTEKQLLTAGKESADYLANKAAEPKVAAELLVFSETTDRLIRDNWPNIHRDLLADIKKSGVGGVLAFYYDPDNEESHQAALKSSRNCGERYAIALPRPKKSVEADKGYPLAHQMSIPPMPAGSVLIFFYDDGNQAMAASADSAASRAREQGCKAISCRKSLQPKMYPETGYVFNYPEMDPAKKEEVLKAVKDAGERCAISMPRGTGPSAAHALKELVGGNSEPMMKAVREAGLTFHGYELEGATGFATLRFGPGPSTTKV